MSPSVRTRQGKFTVELACSGSGFRSGITPPVGRTVHYPPTSRFGLVGDKRKAMYHCL
ncbi:hypothetical protein Hanom_Chr16g01432591 [Helianthus anomalus]